MNRSFKCLFLTIIAAICITSFGTYNHYACISTYNLPTTTKPTVILSCLLVGNGGTERYTLALQQELTNIGINAVLVCQEPSFLATQCEAHKLPYVTCSHRRLRLGPLLIMSGFKAALLSLAVTYKRSLLAIHCSHRHELLTAKKLIAADNVPTILTHHTPSKLATSVRRAADCIITVNHTDANSIKTSNKKDGLDKTVIALPPFFDATRIMTLHPPKQSREQYFQETFNIKLLPCPLLVKIAHFYGNEPHKNHPLLFQAMHDLIYRQNMPVQVALVGSGKHRQKYEQLVHKLKLSDYVHFLGSTEKVATVLHYADINLLSSSQEAFGITLLEGGLLSKPTIVASAGCGAADWLIIDQETGFLFENNNATDLARTITHALTHKKVAQICGKNLYKKVVGEFLPHHTAQTILALYVQLHAEIHSRNT